MKYVRQQIEDFTYSSITDTYPLWNPATTYNTEVSPLTSTSVCRYGSYTYRTVFDGNIGNEPFDGSENWVRNGVSNRHAMIDLRSTTTSVVVGGSIVVEFERLYSMDTLVIGYYSASTITVEHISTDGLTVYRTETISQSANEDVEDYYDYIYSPYSIETNRSTVFDIYPIGNKIRVTFGTDATITDTSCGFMTCGEAVEMGTTRSRVSFRYNSYSTKNVDAFGIITINKRAIQETVDFETMFLKATMPSKRRKIKIIYDEILVFIVDDSGDLEQEGIVVLATIEQSAPILDDWEKSVTAWSLAEVI